MSSKSVTVLTPNGRRHVQRYDANTTLLQILEQTCQKHGFKSEEYDLTHHNRVVDSTVVLRFSGLPNNASLEMAPAKRTRIDSEVILGLQLENGNRLMGTFNPSTTIFEVLTALVPDQCDLDSNPVVIYMRREVYGKDELNETTLKSLGLTGGRAIVRLVHRTPEQLKTQANVSAPLPQKIREDDDYTPTPSSSSSTMETTSSIEVVPNESACLDLPKNVASVSETITDKIETPVENLSVDEKIAESENSVVKTDDQELCVGEEAEYNDNVIIVGERNALVFSQEMSNHLPFNDLPDDFYDLSVSELKKLYLELGKKRQELENVPLRTAALRNVEITEKVTNQILKNQNVVLRILFPDRTVLQGNFIPLDKIDTVKDFVKSYLQNPNQPFDLYVTPPKQVLSPNITLFDARCIPSALLYFGPLDVDLLTISNHQYLQDSILSKLSSPEAALLSASKIRGINKTRTTPLKTDDAVSSSSNIQSVPPAQTSSVSDAPRTASTSDVKLPKWFKTNK